MKIDFFGLPEKFGMVATLKDGRQVTINFLAKSRWHAKQYAEKYFKTMYRHSLNTRMPLRFADGKQLWEGLDTL